MSFPSATECLCPAVAVLAFKAVYALEMTRRENDHTIIALYADMTDMMRVLTQYVHAKRKFLCTDAH
jgi:hypothetical protein